MDDQHTIRASDQDREKVVDRLAGALEDGRLKMDEYVDRMGLAYQAVTDGDLAPLCADLPPASPVTAEPEAAPPAAAPPAEIPRQGVFAELPAVLKVFWTIWPTAVSVNVMVWALVSGTGGQVASWRGRSGWAAATAGRPRTPSAPGST
jgi:Domain of unknown function (DUF1707)